MMKNLLLVCLAILLTACSPETPKSISGTETSNTQVAELPSNQDVSRPTTTMMPSPSPTIELTSSPIPSPTSTLEPSPTPIAPPSYYVSENGSDTNDGRTESNALRTIRAALIAAADGDVIFVLSGIYLEDVVIDKPILLVGDGAETTIINGTGRGDVIFISSDDVVLSGFTVKNSGQDYLGPFDGGDAGIEISHVQNVHIHDMVVIENGLGISIDTANNNLIENNVSKSNLYEGVYLRHSNDNLIWNNTSNVNGGHGGFYVISSSNNIIRGNTCKSNPDHGIKLQRKSNNNLVEFNYCSGSVNSGIFLSDVYYNTIVNNEFTDTGAGIFIRLSDFNEIAENNVRYNGSGIVLDFASYENVIRHNVCSSNQDAGISIRLSSNNNKIVDNECRGNNKAGIEISRASDNKILNNSIFLNPAGILVLCGDLIERSPGDWYTWDEFTRMEKYYVKFKDIVEEKEITFDGKNSLGNIIRGNNIFDNIQFGLTSGGWWETKACPEETVIDAIDNWWGNENGPYNQALDASGQGDKVSDGVLFDPWSSVPIDIP